MCGCSGKQTYQLNSRTIMAVSYRVAVTEIRNCKSTSALGNLSNWIIWFNRLCYRQFSTTIGKGRKKTSKQMQGSTSVKRHHRGKTNVPSVGLVAQEHRVDLGDLSSVFSRLPPFTPTMAGKPAVVRSGMSPSPRRRMLNER